MEAGAHLPQIGFGEGLRPGGRRLARYVDAARDLGFTAISANDHLTFPGGWSDGPTLLAAAVERAGDLELMTSIGLPVLRGPRMYASAMLTLASLARGRVVAGVGPGSSRSDYALAGVDWEHRWSLFDASLEQLRTILDGADPDTPAEPGTMPLWIGSWGSAAGLQRVVAYGDGWLASAYHGTPETFGSALSRLESVYSSAHGRLPGHALVTMWTWVTDHPAEAERVLAQVLAPALGRDPDTLRERVCIGSVEHCAALLAAYAAQGCRRVHFWPIGEGARQLSRLAGEVLPLVSGRTPDDATSSGR